MFITNIIFSFFGILSLFLNSGLISAQNNSEKIDFDKLSSPEILSHLEKLSSLKTPGLNCSYSAELLRLNFSELYMIDGTLSGRVMESAIKMVKNNESICNSADLLVCSNETNRCVCGDPAFGVLKLKPVEFITQNNTCIRKANTFCGTPPLEPISKCESGTKCLSSYKNSTEICTLNTVISYVSNNMSESDKNGKNITKDLVEGKICTCQSDLSLKKTKFEEPSGNFSRNFDNVRIKNSTDPRQILAEVNEFFG